MIRDVHPGSACGLSACGFKDVPSSVLPTDCQVLPEGLNGLLQYRVPTTVPYFLFFYLPRLVGFPFGFISIFYFCLKSIYAIFPSLRPPINFAERKFKLLFKCHASFLHNVRVFIWGFRIRIHLILIRILIQIQHFRLNTDPDPDPIRIQGFDDQKLQRFTAEKN